MTAEPAPVDRRLLPRTFGPMLSRFSTLTEVQREAIPKIVSGRDVLVCSATASGKTETFAAPAAELAARVEGSGALVLIVLPTRALANDIKRRLEATMHAIGVPFGRYTGEHKELTSGALRTIVVTTPEALDSLLARRPSSLAGVRMVVLDELHVLDGTPRGDQLRVLLHRLETVCAHRPQRVAASATIDDPQGLAGRYLRDAEIVVVPGRRGLRIRRFDGKGVLAVARSLDALAGAGFRKVLVFCRGRNAVETLATKLKHRTRFGDAVFAHHGSMSKIARERTERLFLQAPAAVCVATMTLELGIDIGTVDYVLLNDLPSDVSSLLQRVGRGCRRNGATRAGYLASRPGDVFLFETMFRLAREGRLSGRPYGFRPSVLVQQALVLACAETYLRPADLESVLPSEILAELGTDVVGATLDSAVAGGLLERAGADRVVATARIEGRWDAGALHSNIDEERGIDVVDRMTGDAVGTIDAAEHRKIEVAGRSRVVVKQDPDRILTDTAVGGNPARFHPRGAPSVPFAFARAAVEALGTPEGAIGIVSVPGHHLMLHGLGTAGASLLAWHLDKHGVPKPERINAYTQAVPPSLNAMPPLPPEALDAFLNDRFATLERLTAPGPFAKQSPMKHRRAATRRILGLDELAAFLRAARVIELDARDVGISIVEDLA